MVGPEAFTEVRYLAHAKQMQALTLIPAWSTEFHYAFGRAAGGLVRRYEIEDAETVVVALGSVLGTVKDAVDEMRANGEKIGVLGISCFRPWPLEAVARALGRARRVVVLEKSLAVGVGGIVSTNVRTTLAPRPVPVYDVIAGLGGRPITRKSLRALLDDVLAERLEPARLHFLDLDRELVAREMQRLTEPGRTGPHAENIVRDLGTVAARSH